jgi:hypothetical protein
MKTTIEFDDFEIEKICKILREQQTSEAYDDRSWEEHLESCYFRLKELVSIIKQKLIEKGIYEEPFTP